MGDDEIDLVRVRPASAMACWDDSTTTATALRKISLPFMYR